MGCAGRYSLGDRPLVFSTELARSWNKPLWVWDATERTWNRWVPQASAWKETAEPRITAQQFTGTGDRSLSDAGRDAIKSLFERSFGPS